MSVPRATGLPLGVEPLSVPTPRGEFATLRAGDVRDPVVLLVPGFTGSKEDFTPLLPLLADAGFHAVAYDQAGQHESPQFERYDFDDWVGDLLAIGAHLQDGDAGIHLVGHSFGGLVSRAAVLAEPGRFASLTLLDSGPGALPQMFHQRLVLLREIAPSHSMQQIWDLKEMLEADDGVEATEPKVQEFLRIRWVASSAAALAAIADELMTAADRTDELADTGTRCLVAFGADDISAWPLDQQRDMARRLGCPVVAIPDAAHSPAVEQPQATATALVEHFRAGSGSRRS